MLAGLPALVGAQNPLFIPDTLSGATVNLQLQNGQVQFFPGQITETMGVNGNLLGPTIILYRNSNVTINVDNQLSETTTIHWHGLHVSPQNDGGPHITIPAGTTWSPSFQVMDWAGTYWYHPHLHMHTNEHVQKGIAGMIIVRDAIEAAITLPRTYGVDDFPLVIQTKSFDSNNQIITGVTPMDTAIMINGTLDPYLNVPSQVVRLRLLNGSSERSFMVGFSNNMNFHMIASDGGLRENSLTLTRLMLSPGERAEILLDLGAMQGQTISLMNYGSAIPSGNYGALQEGMGPGPQITGYDNNPMNGSDFSLLELHVGPQTTGAVTTTPTVLATHNPWPEASANTTRTIDFSMVNMGPSAINGPFVFNMMPFDMMMINYYIPFENIEIWTLTNNTPISHPFHIHDVHFYVLDVNGGPVPAHQQGRKDVILVPGGGGVVRFITRFEDYYDDDYPYMFHCHMLTHEDDGMMGQFIVMSPSNDIVESEMVFPGMMIPNPSEDYTELLLFEEKGVVGFEMVDITGKQVLNGTTAGKKTPIDCSGISPGIYFIRLEGFTWVLRFVKS